MMLINNRKRLISKKFFQNYMTQYFDTGHLSDDLAPSQLDFCEITKQVQFKTFDVFVLSHWSQYSVQVTLQSLYDNRVGNIPILYVKKYVSVDVGYHVNIKSKQNNGMWCSSSAKYESSDY